jgi:hypothetical protein
MTADFDLAAISPTAVAGPDLVYPLNGFHLMYAPFILAA